MVAVVARDASTRLRAFGCTAASITSDSEERQRDAPRRCLVVDEGAAPQIQQGCSRGHHECDDGSCDGVGRRPRRMRSAESARLPQESHRPVHRKGGGQQHRHATQPAVERVGEEGGRHSQHRGPRPEVHLRVAVDDDALEADDADPPVPGEPGVGLRVEVVGVAVARWNSSPVPPVIIQNCTTSPSAPPIHAARRRWVPRASPSLTAPAVDGRRGRAAPP